MATVGDIRRLIEETAKPGYAYEWDNVGLHAGDPSAPVARVLVTLDVTRAVIEEAVAKKCEMILSHHPLIHAPIYKASVETYEGEILSLLYQNGLALYCAHTSLDIAQGGVNDALCELLGLSDVTLFEPFEKDGEVIACGRRGVLPRPMSGEELLKFVKEKTGAKTVLHGGLDGKTFRTLALSTGGAGEAGLACTDDAFLTGEIKYHTAQEMKRRNKPFMAVGHFQTEYPVCAFFAKRLQKRADVLQYNVTFVVSQTDTDPFDV